MSQKADKRMKAMDARHREKAKSESEWAAMLHRERKVRKKRGW